MKIFRCLPVLLALSAVRLAAAAPTLSGPLTLNPDAPRLMVVISIDQFRADYLERFQPWFVSGGFNRLLTRGAVYAEAHHRHAMTATAPGHSTLLTGVSPDVHGIIANEWYDFSLGKIITSIEDPAAPLVGATPLPAVRSPGGVLETEENGSPRRLLADTAGDQLKLRFGDQCRVISMSNKDRAAILMGGHLADAAYWMVRDHFVTSRYYRDALPEWAVKFNAEDRINRAFGHVWDRLLAQDIYDQVQGPDDARGEDPRPGLGRTFPRRIDGGNPAAITPKFYDAYHVDPECQALLAEFAKRAVAAEQLGRHPAPDLLCVSFSQIDYVGHSFGPDSHEIMDSVLRLDRVLADFFAYLDREVGAGKYGVVLSADHGSCPLPERTQTLHREFNAGRMDWPALKAGIETDLGAAFGVPANGAAWTIQDGFGYRLIPAVLAAQKVSAAAARAVIKQSLLKSPQVAIVWTRDELLGQVGAAGRYLEAWRLSYHAERGEDVVCSPKPYIVSRGGEGTNHGTPYDYDNHVPLIWFGPGIPAGRHLEWVGTDSLAPTLCALLGIPRPAQSVAPRLF